MDFWAGWRMLEDDWDRTSLHYKTKRSDFFGGENAAVFAIPKPVRGVGHFLSVLVVF